MKILDRKKDGILKKKYLPLGIEFEFTGAEQIQFPLSSNDPAVLRTILPQGAAWAALEDLWEENLLEQKAENSWIVPYNVYIQIYQEEDTDLFNALGLPLPGDLDIELTTSGGGVSDPNFRIFVDAHHPDYGPLRDGEKRRYGPVFLVSEECIVPLTPQQQKLFDLAAGVEVKWKMLEERMRHFASVKEAALAVGARLDGYLQNEDYHFAKEAELDIEELSPHEIKIKLRIKGAEEFEQEVENQLPNDNPPAVITIATPRKARKRLVLDKTLQENISQLPPKIIGADVPRFLTNPEQIIPEGFDLSLFSKRVRGLRIKVYNSRPYIHVRRSTGGWFEGVPGIALEDWSPGETGASSGLKNNLSRETYQELLRQAREKGEEYVQFGDSWIRVDTEMGEKFEKVLSTMPLQEDGAFRIPAGSILDIYENLDLLEFVDSGTLTQDDTQLPDDLPTINVPKSFCGELYPHQLQGYRWLNRVSKYSIGGLLADDMGLGKTIQIIAHMLKLKEDQGDKPHLVVVPKSLADNWTREINSFTNRSLSIFHYDGDNRRYDTKSLQQFDVVLTTYETLRRDQAKLATINWNLVACDEAQYVKNPTAQRTSAVKALKSKHRAALTGTPVENGLIEFWCIMDFIQPGLLGSWSDFRTNYEHPIIEGPEDAREQHVQKLLSEIKGHYLRRMKEEILKDLPPKNPDFRSVAFGAEQLNLYRQIAQKGKTGGKAAALGAILHLMIISAHPLALSDTELSLGDKNPEELCPKLEETLKIISEIKNKAEKVIIFTDFKRVQKILQDAIRRRFDIWPDIINGEVTNNRQTIIDIFSKKIGFNVLILGHQVGGVGLNITAANHVIHYTRPWNPAKENQATDRVHRIGQTKPVTIYYPIIKDTRFKTVEERLDELIELKKALARDVLRSSSELIVKREELFECLDVKA